MPKLLFCFLLFIIPLSADQFDAIVEKLLKGSVPQITSAELATELKGKTPPLLLDIREYKEFQVSHLQGAQFLGYKKVNYSRLDDIKKSIPIIVYCSVGKRSEDIGEVLRKKGFTNVKNLRGGIFRWANEKRPIYKDKSTETKEVHPYNKSWGKWLKEHVVKKH